MRHLSARESLFRHNIANHISDTTYRSAVDGPTHSHIDALGRETILSLFEIEMFTALDFENSNDFMAFDRASRNASRLLTNLARQDDRQWEDECDPAK